MLKINVKKRSGHYRLTLILISLLKALPLFSDVREQENQALLI